MLESGSVFIVFRNNAKSHVLALWNSSRDTQQTPGNGGIKLENLSMDSREVKKRKVKMDQNQNSLGQ